MDDVLKRTTSYMIIDQIVNHVYGPDIKIDNNDLSLICLNFKKCGGSWESLIRGEVDQFRILEGILGLFIENEKMYRISFNISNVSD